MAYQDAAYWRQFRKDRTSRGLCLSCLRIAAPDKHYCLQHLEQQRVRWHTRVNHVETRYQYHVTHFKTKGRFSNLSLDEFAYLQSQPCHYCARTAEESDGFNGIDRVNNEIGYTLSNCVPCCTECNFAKRTRTAEQFISHCLRVAQNHI
jgi:hypothetical protein